MGGGGGLFQCGNLVALAQSAAELTQSIGDPLHKLCRYYLQTHTAAAHTHLEKTDSYEVFLFLTTYG